jgi:uncharacterized protein (DUF362 family)
MDSLKRFETGPSVKVTTMDASIVALVKGPDRYQNIRDVLALLGDKAVFGKKHVIKPNFVSTEVGLAATHREAVRAVVDFLRQQTGDSVIIAEGAAASDTFKGYERFGFMGLAETYGDVELRDLNRDAYEIVTLYDQELRPQPFRIAKTIWDCDHRISLAIPKTHDAAIVTLSVKCHHIDNPSLTAKNAMTSITLSKRQPNLGGQPVFDCVHQIVIKINL